MANLRFTNMREFEVGLKDFNEGSQELAMKVLRKLALDIFRNVVRKTPVDTGLLRGSWFIGVNSPPQGVGSPGGNGPSAIFAVLALDRVKAGDSVWIVNNVEYAPYVEEGTDRMAPRYMLRRSIEEAGGTQVL